jgi:hypothetical protein
MFARSQRPSLGTLQFFTVASLAVSACLLSQPAWAQADKSGGEAAANKATDEEEEEDDQAGEAKKPAEVTAKAEPTEAAKPAAPPEAGAGDFEGLKPDQMKLGWDGSAEIDVGYARYDYELPAYKPERFYDFRGRFVVGPVLEHDFDERHFFRASGQVVAWVREEKQRYQVNADDVYVQAGRRKSWDLKLGRFESWRVYHKGLGFDVYTLDDTGALKEPPFNQEQFGVRMYEVSRIYWREMAGKGALHVYPLDVLGFELVGFWGSEQTTIHSGARVAADLNLKFLRVMAAAEYRKRETTDEQRTLDAAGVEGPCDKCFDRNELGFGGGAVAKLGPVELGLNLAKLRTTNYMANGKDDIAGSHDTTTFGGYLEVDPGKPLFQRSLIVGVGANRTELLVDNQDFERHDQGVAYIAFPLGFNEGMIKFVVSKADLLFEDADQATGIVQARNSDMLAGRLRVRFSF